MTRLDGLREKPAWITHLGCHLGCIEYLGLEISRAWVYGGTGHAFAINIHQQLCPSGPTAWRTEIVDRLASNLGYLVDGVRAHRSQDDFSARQAIAWALVRGCTDTGVPCYGWELGMPEWYVITGYDEGGYYFSGPAADQARQPLPWQELATGEIGWLCVQCVLPCEHEPDDVIVAQALEFALDSATGKFTDPNYTAGPAAFVLWAHALDTGIADRFGTGYNAACWRECREQAVAFLEEARERLTGRADALFEEAATHYAAVAAALTAVSKRLPFELPTEGSEGPTARDPEAAALLRDAGAAEERGLDALARLRDALA